MDKIKKYLIRGISIIMASFLLVMSPLSDYADTQGISQTHASAGTAILTAGAVVALGLLAYNVIVPENNLDAVASDVLNHVGTYFSSTAEDIANLKKGAVQWVFNATFLEGVKHYLESKIGNLDTPQTVGVSGAGRLYFDTLPFMTAEEIAYLKNANSAKVAEVDSKLANFNGFMKKSWTGTGYNYSVASFWPIDISSFDGAYYDSEKGLMFYNFGNIDNAVSLSTLGYESGDEYFSSTPWKFNYYSDYSQLSITTLDEYMEQYPTGLYKNFAYFSGYGSNNSYHLSYSEVQYHGDSFLYSSSKENAIKGVYTSYPYSTNSDSEVATSYGGYDVANPNTLVGAIITQEIANTILDSTRTDIQEKTNDTSLAPKDLSDSINGLVAQSFLDNLLNYEEVLPPSVEDNDGVLDKYKEEIQYGDGVVSTAPTDITTGEQAIIDQSVTNTNGIIGALNKVILGITTVISSIVDLPSRIVESFTSILTSIRNAVLSVAKSVWDLFSDSITSIKESVKTIADSKTDTETGSGTVTDNGLLSGLRSLLEELFIPDTAELEETMYGYVEKFSFAFMVYTIIEDIGSILNGGGEPPEIYIHFEDSEDPRFQQLGTMKVLDFTWYEQYKEYGDFIISAILWAFFLLRFVHGLPNILRGVPQGVVSSADPNANYLETGIRKI